MKPSRSPLAIPHAHRLLIGALLAIVVCLLCPGVGQAKISMIGSPLSVPATLNTSGNLAYPGTNTAVPAAPDAPNGVVHTSHFGADTALWNSSSARGEERVPATGQAKKIQIEGCAQRALNGPVPLTSIHFQDLSPLPGGGAKVNLTSQGYDLPICGENGAGASTVTTFLPVNLCVSAGDYVGFNDSGGFVPNFYRSGVPFQVLGAVKGATTDSFIKDNGTGNGSALAASVTSAMDGFAVNRNEELLMRVTLATGADATHICPGGKQGLPAPLPAIRLNAETYGISHNRIVTVAVFCRVSPCDGVATLSTRNGPEYGHTSFVAQKETTTHIRIPVKADLLRKIRAKNGVSATLSAVVDGQRFTQAIAVKILS